MKRRVFSKTTPFHTFKKKKKERAERCHFERHCSSFFFPPNMQRGRRKKGCFNLNFLPATLSPGAHRPDTMADHPPCTYQKTGEGGRALAVAPNGRPDGCSPCSTAKSHSLGSINNSQHSSNGRRGGTDEGKRKKRKKQRREREEIERRREKEERKKNREEEREERKDQPENNRKKKQTEETKRKGGTERTNQTVGNSRSAAWSRCP